ncbi:hypothetical protein SAMN03080598_00813 [Algoriphagus boritolerans DSM 17298 = JCM 18970]|uniref:Uncharacterized protein n=2 Tax=Algoriphagus TaxID=246875 RepID=A0A1H5TKG3_9BACT|nr:hypothetical protein SAMN03080598_00813 [Algoriphagus boritolerans DSM 17298 = JCM 18970]
MLLSLFWLVGLAASFSFPPDAKTSKAWQDNQSSLSELFSPELTFRTSGENPGVPGFKADLGFTAFVNSGSRIDWLLPHSQYRAPAFFQKSRPLFDVLITFFHFFYTW